VLSNDSDLAAPMRTINDQRKRPVGLMTPPTWKDAPAVELKAVAAFHHRISMLAIRECQFPDQITDAKGRTIRRPDGW